MEGGSRTAKGGSPDFSSVNALGQSRVTATALLKEHACSAKESWGGKCMPSLFWFTVHGSRFMVFEGTYASDALQTHEDLRKAGLKVDYDSGKIVAPDGQIIQMKMQSTVWTIPVMMEKQVHAFSTVVVPQTRDAFMQLHESLFLPGVIKFFIQVDATIPDVCVYINVQSSSHVAPFLSVRLISSFRPLHPCLSHASIIDRDNQASFSLIIT